MIYFFNIVGIAMLVASFLIMGVVDAVADIERLYRLHTIAAGVSSSTSPIVPSSSAPKSNLSLANGGSPRIAAEA